MTIKAITIAQEFLNLAAREEKKLTNMQLQKLVFFAHGTYLVVSNGNPLFYDEIKAWDFGPVIPNLYETLRRYKNGFVDPIIAPEENDRISPDSLEMNVIRVVWDTYKSFDGWKLSQISHLKGSPWDIIWNQKNTPYREIPNDLIKDYYNSQIKLN